ncbi:hypothetical protein SOPP22_18430 [Shewanella sp. OPT22]|nr:hypothetical protein SOPP22_18430 [Shewanella sp. OPT22]
MATVQVDSPDTCRQFQQHLKDLKDLKKYQSCKFEIKDAFAYQYQVNAALEKDGKLSADAKVFHSGTTRVQATANSELNKLTHSYKVRVLSDSSEEALTISDVIPNITAENIVEIIQQSSTQRALEILNNKPNIVTYFKFKNSQILNSSDTREAIPPLPFGKRVLTLIMERDLSKAIAIMDLVSDSNNLKAELLKSHFFKLASSPSKLQAELSKLDPEILMQVFKSQTGETLLQFLANLEPHYAILYAVSACGAEPSTSDCDSNNAPEKLLITLLSKKEHISGSDDGLNFIDWSSLVSRSSFRKEIFDLYAKHPSLALHVMSLIPKQLCTNLVWPNFSIGEAKGLQARLRQELKEQPEYVVQGVYRVICNKIGLIHSDFVLINETISRLKDHSDNPEEFLKQLLKVSEEVKNPLILRAAVKCFLSSYPRIIEQFIIKGVSNGVISFADLLDILNQPTDADEEQTNIKVCPELYPCILKQVKTNYLLVKDLFIPSRNTQIRTLQLKLLLDLIEQNDEVSDMRLCQLFNTFQLLLSDMAMFDSRTGKPNEQPILLYALANNIRKFRSEECVENLFMHIHGFMLVNYKDYKTSASNFLLSEKTEQFTEFLSAEVSQSSAVLTKKEDSEEVVRISEGKATEADILVLLKEYPEFAYELALNYKEEAMKPQEIRKFSGTNTQQRIVHSFLVHLAYLEPESALTVFQKLSMKEQARFMVSNVVTDYAEAVTGKTCEQVKAQMLSSLKSREAIQHLMEMLRSSPEQLHTARLCLIYFAYFSPENALVVFQNLNKKEQVELMATNTLSINGEEIEEKTFEQLKAKMLSSLKPEEAIEQLWIMKDQIQPASEWVSVASAILTELLEIDALGKSSASEALPYARLGRYTAACSQPKELNQLLVSSFTNSYLKKAFTSGFEEVSILEAWTTPERLESLTNSDALENKKTASEEPTSSAADYT